MEIKELIELIVENTPKLVCPLFTFCVINGNATQVINQLVGVDDAVSFLFDCDMKLWELMDYNVVLCDGNWNTLWRITLRDTTT